MFPKTRQEAECTLILGTFVELVDKDVVLKQKELLVNTTQSLVYLRTSLSMHRDELSPKSNYLFLDDAISCLCMSRVWGGGVGLGSGDSS